MRIICKSINEIWEKEKDGRKPNTVRELDGKDEIMICNADTGICFERKITDITFWKSKIIISWAHEKDKLGN